MSDAIEQYLDQVMKHANLPPHEQQQVRAELKDHLLFIAAKAAQPQEVFAMLNKEFGDPKRIGQAIGGIQSRFSAYLKKLRRRLPMQIAAILILALAVRLTVAEAFICTGVGVSPIIPQGSRVLVYKLARTFSPGDVIVFRVADGTNRLGIVKCMLTPDQAIVHRNGQPDQMVALGNIVGRVFLNTR